MKKLRINVTANDIKNGIQTESCACAVALACKRKLKDEFQDVGSTSLTIKKDGYLQGVRLNEKVVTFIRQFDKDKRLVKPFTFTLTIPE